MGASRAPAAMAALRAGLATARQVRGGVGVKVPRCGVRQFSPPPADAALAEELVMHRVREKVQSELRQDRTELLNKIDSAVKSLGPHFDAMNTKIEAVNEAVSTKIEAVNTKIEAMNTKIDGTKSDISFQAAAYGLGGATFLLSALNFFFGKSVAVVDAKT